MEFSDLKQKSDKELHTLLAESREEMRRLRFAAHEHELKKVHVVRAVKKRIAQILTLLKVKATK